MSLELAAQHLASRGRKGDTMLVHMAPEEVSGLQALAKAAGGTLTVNPDTGLPEANFLKSLLPTLIGAGLMFATGGTAAPLIAGISNPALIGLGVGGFEALRTKNLGKGLMAGLGAFGGAGLTGGLMGAAAAKSAAGAAGASGAAGAAPAMSMAPATASPATAALTQAGVPGLVPPAMSTATTAATAGAAPGMMKYGLAAMSPMMGAEQEQKPYDGGGPNPYQYTYEFDRPSDPRYDSREALQLTGRYVPYAAGGPVEDMSQRNAMETLMANGGQMFAKGGETKEDVSKGMTGASAEAFRYLMGQSAASPATLAAQRTAQAAPVAQTPATPAAAPTSRSIFGRVAQRSTGSNATPSYSFDPQTGAFTALSSPTPAPAPEVAPGLSPTHTDYGGKNGGLMTLAAGGVSHLGDYSDGGRLLKGPGDGVSDSIPATIADKRPARLADGEFVVPARIVSELGNGSTEAGARKLYAMMDRVQKARGKTTGKNRVAVNTRADKLLPA